MSGKGLDPRLNAYREDLAAADLHGRVDAPRFVEGERRQVRAASAPVRRAARPDAPLDTEALFGELVTVYDEREGRAWGQLEGDGYVGYLPAAALSAELGETTHRVTALRTFLYSAPDIKTPPQALVSLNARLAAAGKLDRFLSLAGGGYAIAAHAAPLREAAADYVSVAERFAGTPYLWGGRTSLGLDCSALVQLSLEAAGIDAPRDTDMQEAALGAALPGETDLAKLARGDLVFWKGHVGIATGEGGLVHANGHHMETVIEPLAEAVERIAAQHGPVSSVRRLSGGGDAR